MSCAEGDIGNIYQRRPVRGSAHDLEQLRRPETQIMMNLGNPDSPFRPASCRTTASTGRMEFIISEAIKVHPMALCIPRVLRTRGAPRSIVCRGFAKPADFFVQRLAEGVGTFAAAFYPKPVIVRMSDLKTNEYASLIGGRWFEPGGGEPMLGFRGASRYAHPAYAEGFALECAAMRHVREAMGLTNVDLMIPFCRRISEARRSSYHGDSRARARKDGLEIT